MSKFSKFTQAAPVSLRPGAPANAPYPPPPAGNQPSYPPPRPSSAQPPYAQSPLLQPNYGAPPPLPPSRPTGSPQPSYQQPPWQQQYQQPSYPQQNMYGSQQYSGQNQQPYGQQPYQQPQYGQQPYQQPYQPPAQGYGAPQGGYPGQQPPYPGGPGQPQPPTQQQYGGGAPSPQPGQNIGAYKQLLQGCIQEKNLQTFYPPGHPALDQIANRASQQVNILAQQWRISTEIASDIVKLALYDVILYVDDSGSMAFEENGERIDDLKLILSRVAFATSLFDEDGIQVRFMNSTEQGNGIRNQQQVEEMISRTRFSGMTPMGRELQNKVLGPLVLSPARSGQLRKPVLVIIITDGQPTGESPRDIANIIKNATAELVHNPRYGKGALAFQFAQVGNDTKARDFLKDLDEQPGIGDVIDCTSNFEVEQDEMSHANPPVNLTPELWLIKLLLGSIDSSYDKKDETAAAGPPQGGYGGPPPGQYGGYQPQGQGGYPQQQQGGYGPPQQGQYGRPPPGPPGQPGYPPQQGGYPPQQGGYGAPPPPRY